MRSLVLIGHGSHLNADSAQAVYDYADLLRARGYFDEVLEGYWKEEPSLRQILRTTKATDVTVIPMFISEGYFTETVIPREMNLGHQGPVPVEGIVRQIGGRTVRYMLPYGVHPKMTELLLERAHEACPDISSEDTGLLIIGHGTTRNTNSSKVVYDNADRLRKMGVFKEVHALFLDQEPKINNWQERFSSRKVVMIPFFTAEGWHTQETIPEDLGLSGQISLFDQHTAYYGMPVGTHPGITDVILEVAQSAAQHSTQGGEWEPEHYGAWMAFLERARHGMRLGEVEIAAVAGLFEVRPVLDAGRDDLELIVTPEGLRQKVRLSDGGEYRAVHTLRNLPRGWRAVLDEHDLLRAVHYLYPAVIEEAYSHFQGTLHVTPWASTARRQTGIYAKVQAAIPEDVQTVMKAACANCLKTPLWWSDSKNENKLERSLFDGVPGGIPCPEACTFVVAEVRETVAERQKKAATELALETTLEPV